MSQDRDPDPGLRQRLVAQEQALADLTAHCLSLVDQVAAARQQLLGQGELEATVARLREMLADARARVRLAATVVAGAPATAPAAEVCVWGVDARALRRLRKLQEQLGELPLAVLVPPALAAAAAAALPGASVLEVDGGTAAAVWNQAMAMSRSPVVVLLHACVLPAPGALPALAAAVTDGTAVAGPLLVHGKQRWLGLGGDELLALAPAAPPAGKPALQNIDFAAPELFALSRAAFDRCGPFDQDLLTPVALAEWCLRARGAQLRRLGVGTAKARVGAFPAADEDLVRRDRLVALARHAPQRLPAAASAMGSLWRQPPDAVAALLGAAFARLPDAASLPQAKALLAQLAAGLANAPPPSPAAPTELLPAMQSALRELEARLTAASTEGVRQQLAAAATQRQEAESARDAATAAWREQAAARAVAEERLAAAQAAAATTAAELQALRTAAAQQQADLQAAAAAAAAQVAELQQGLHAVEREREGLRVELAAEAERLVAVRKDLERGLAIANDMNARNKALQAAGHEQEERLRALRLQLKEREDWIALLLIEVQKRRLSPRDLLPHERQFLAGRKDPPA